MLRVPRLTHCLQKLSPNRFATTMATLTELVVVVFLAVRLVLAIDELLFAERAMADDTSEMFRMPLMSERFDVLLGDFVIARETASHLCEFAANQHDQHCQNATKAREKRQQAKKVHVEKPGERIIGRCRNSKSYQLTDSISSSDDAFLEFNLLKRGKTPQLCHLNCRPFSGHVRRRCRNCGSDSGRFFSSRVWLLQDDHCHH